MSDVRVNTKDMVGDGGGYIPLSTEAITLIFDHWADCVLANGLTETMRHYDYNLREDLYCSTGCQMR